MTKHTDLCISTASYNFWLSWITSALQKTEATLLSSLRVKYFYMRNRGNFQSILFCYVIT